MKDSSHSPSRRALFSPSLWKWQQNVYLPLRCRNRMHAGKWAGDQTKDFLERAQTSYTPAWLLSLLLYQVSTRETAGVLLNTRVCESLIPGKRLLHWQKRREWFKTGFCIHSAWWAWIQRSYGRYKSKVCLHPSSIMTQLEKKKWFREVPAVSEAHIKRGNISLSVFTSAHISVLNSKLCPSIFRVTQ